MVTQTKTAEQTINLGRQIAKTLGGGELLLLEGELGSGKTTFVKGLAQGLGVKEDVRSATFLLMTPYPAGKQLTFVHVDGYRLTKPDEVYSIGLEDYLGRPDVVVAIEWPTRLTAAISKFIRQPADQNSKILKITFETIDEEARRISY